MDDAGPGFVVQTNGGEYIYLCGEILEESVRDEGGNLYVSNEIELLVDGESLELKRFRCLGDRIPITEQFSVAEIPVSLSSGFVVLPTESMSIPPSSTCKIHPNDVAI